MSSTFDHVIRSGPKDTISSPSGRGISVDYKFIFRLLISRTVLEKWVKKSEKSRNLGQF